MRNITKPERPVKELLIYCLDPGEARAVPGGRDCFCFLLIGRRRILTRDPILCEPEVSLVGKFRFFVYIYTYDIYKKFVFYLYI